MNARLAFAASAALFLLVGCGRAPLSGQSAALLRTQALASQATALAPVVESRAVPPQSAFKIVEGSVVKILPTDNSGLTHQNFQVKTAGGETFTVNNSTTHGSEVEGLALGVALKIRGVLYNNNGRKGIHWTHMANKPGDAGWIETPDGRRFE